MQVVLNPTELLQAAKTAALTVTTNPMPVLEGLKLELNSEEQALYITGMGLNGTITAKCPNSNTIAHADAPNSCVVNARKFLAVIPGFIDSKSSFFIEVADNTITLKSGKSKVSLPVIEAERFPALPSVKSPHGLTIDAAAFLDALNASKYAISSDAGAAQVFSNLLCFLGPNNSIQTVATDGHRLALYNSNFEPSSAYQFLLPGSSVKVLCGLMQGIDGPVELSIDTNKLKVALDGVEFISSLSEGKFPNFRAIIPKADAIKTRVSVAVAELVKAAKLAAITADTQFYAVRIAIKSDASIVVSSKSALQEQSHISIQAVNFEGIPIELNLNAKYLAQALSSFSCEQVTIKATTTNGAVIIEPETPTQGIEQLALMMPMKH